MSWACAAVEGQDRINGLQRHRCGECAKGDIDQDLSGNGRYDVEWYAVPCNVGNSKLSYHTVSKSHWTIAFVIANHRCLTYAPLLGLFCTCARHADHAACCCVVNTLITLNYYPKGRLDTHICRPGSPLRLCQYGSTIPGSS